LVVEELVVKVGEQEQVELVDLENLQELQLVVILHLLLKEDVQ
jgi:hypothetical protein